MRNILAQATLAATCILCGCATGERIGPIAAAPAPMRSASVSALPVSTLDEAFRSLGARARTRTDVLSFPVAMPGAAIASVFGDPRDGGAREHHGVDIFAPRGTPVVAAGDGRVTDVRNTPVGGLVIWMEDFDRGLIYYYAHLEEQYVRRGQIISAGDTIGAVGNSGNARGVNPHLHFGVYLPGTIAVDPAPMLGAPPAAGYESR